LGGTTFVRMADPIGVIQNALYTAITQDGAVSLEISPDWYVMGIAGFEPTTFTG